MGRTPTGGGKKCKKKGTSRPGVATKTVLRAKFELAHADVIYKAVHKHLKTVNGGGGASDAGAAAEVDAKKRGESAVASALLAEAATRAFDEDLPGGGQFYCMYTGRHFESQDALTRHQKSKQYKRDRKKVLTGPAPHEQGDADAAAGMGPPDNGKKSTKLPTPMAE